MSQLYGALSANRPFSELLKKVVVDSSGDGNGVGLDRFASEYQSLISVGISGNFLKGSFTAELFRKEIHSLHNCLSVLSSCSDKFPEWSPGNAVGRLTKPLYDMKSDLVLITGDQLGGFDADQLNDIAPFCVSLFNFLAKRSDTIPFEAFGKANYGVMANRAEDLVKCFEGGAGLV